MFKYVISALRRVGGADGDLYSHVLDPITPSE